MPVEKTDVIDFAVHNPKIGELRLVMFENRDWHKSPEAVKQLDMKFATYAEFVQIARQQPEYAKCPVLIRLDHFSPINENVAEVLRRWAGKLAGIPVNICSRRTHWSPLVSFVKRIAAKFSGPDHDVLRWARDPGSAPPPTG